MSISSAEHSGTSDLSIVSPIRRSRIRYGSVSSHNGSLFSLPLPVSINLDQNLHGSNKSLSEKSSIKSKSQSVNELVESSSISMKSARSHISMTSKFSSIFPDEYFYNTESSGSSKSSRGSEQRSLISDDEREEPLSRPTSGATIYSDAQEEERVLRADEVLEDSSYIHDSINLSRNSYPQGLVNTGRLSPSNVTSSFLSVTNNTSSEPSKKAVIAPVEKIPDSGFAQVHRFGESHPTNTSEEPTGAVSISTSSLLSPSTPSRRKLGRILDNEASPSSRNEDNKDLFTKSEAHSRKHNPKKNRKSLALPKRAPKLLELGTSDSNPNENAISKASDSHKIDKATPKEYPRWSKIRKTGPRLPQSGYAYSVRSGLPRLPNFPEFKPFNDLEVDSAKPTEEPKAGIRPIKADMEAQRLRKYDKWGRKEASFSKSMVLLIVCLLFPPLWLFIGAGYFDITLGTIPKWAKICSLLLTFITLAAGTALVVVFSLID